MSRHPFLVGKAVADRVHQPCDSAETVQTTARQVGDMGDAAKRHQVMRAYAVHRDAAQRDHVAARILEAFAERLGGVRVRSRRATCAATTLAPSRPCGRCASSRFYATGREKVEIARSGMRPDRSCRGEEYRSPIRARVDSRGRAASGSQGESGLMIPRGVGRAQAGLIAPIPRRAGDRYRRVGGMRPESCNCR